MATENTLCDLNHFVDDAGCLTAAKVASPDQCNNLGAAACKNVNQQEQKQQKAEQCIIQEGHEDYSPPDAHSSKNYLNYFSSAVVCFFCRQDCSAMSGNTKDYMCDGCKHVVCVLCFSRLHAINCGWSPYTVLPVEQLIKLPCPVCLNNAFCRFVEETYAASPFFHKDNFCCGGGENSRTQPADLEAVGFLKNNNEGSSGNDALGIVAGGADDYDDDDSQPSKLITTLSYATVVTKGLPTNAGAASGDIKTAHVMKQQQQKQQQQYQQHKTHKQHGPFQQGHQLSQQTTSDDSSARSISRFGWLERVFCDAVESVCGRNFWIKCLGAGNSPHTAHLLQLNPQNELVKKLLGSFGDSSSGGGADQPSYIYEDIFNIFAEALSYFKSEDQVFSAWESACRRGVAGVECMFFLNTSRLEWKEMASRHRCREHCWSSNNMVTCRVCKINKHALLFLRQCGSCATREIYEQTSVVGGTSDDPHCSICKFSFHKDDQFVVLENKQTGDGRPTNFYTLKEHKMSSSSSSSVAKICLYCLASGKFKNSMRPGTVQCMFTVRTHFDQARPLCKWFFPDIENCMNVKRCDRFDTGVRVIKTGDYVPHQRRGGKKAVLCYNRNHHPREVYADQDIIGQKQHPVITQILKRPSH